MIGRIAVVTDSASYLPEHVRRRFGVHIVPMTVMIDGRDYREGIDLDADLFYPMLEHASAVTTSQPAPGMILEAYQAAAAGGSDVDHLDSHRCGALRHVAVSESSGFDVLHPCYRRR